MRSNDPFKRAMQVGVLEKSVFNDLAKAWFNGKETPLYEKVETKAGTKDMTVRDSSLKKIGGDTCLFNA